jgi:adenylate cyclase
VDAHVTGETLAFEGWHFDRQAHLLYRQDASGTWTPVPIGSRAQDILTLLLEQPGTLVSKDALLEAAWPNTAVEPNNLSVQIAALRRVLDRDRSDGSYIQTVSGRGYRFAAPEHSQAEALRLLHTRPINGNATDDVLCAEAGGDHIVTASDTATTTDVSLGSKSIAHRRRRALLAALLAGLSLAIGASLFLGPFHKFRLAGPNDWPRLSLVILPFENLSGDAKEDYLADGITDDLTTELSHIPGALVVARESAYTFKGKAVDVRKLGEGLGVRYALEGSVRRLGSTLRVNVQLVSTETGVHLWSDRFDESISELSVGQEQIVTRMRDQLGISMVEIENARSLRERPTNPDAFDLILRARSIRNLPPSQQRDEEALALLERALWLDPSSVYAMTYIAYYLVDAVGNEGWGDFEKLQRAERLLARARAIAPDSEVVLNTYVLWLGSLGRCPEVIEAAQRALKTDPTRMRVWTGTYNQLAGCKVWTGHAEEGLALQEKADQLNPLSPWKYIRYQQMGTYSLWLGRNPDAIMYLERSLAMKPEDDRFKHWQYRKLAAAYARIGNMEEARQYMSKAERLWPYDTVRSHYPGNPSSSVLAAQIRSYQDGLRLAGERDHADEDADFGVPTDGVLHGDIAGFTPKGAPGVKTIRTAELSRFLVEARPILIDTLSYSWGRSIPGAVGLKFAGLGGSFTDAAQDHLRSKMRDLTSGDLNRPIVAVGWNSERFDGRNLALRLAALGYTQVHWYRGGREAWEVDGLPETEPNVQE